MDSEYPQAVSGNNVTVRCGEDLRKGHGWCNLDGSLLSIKSSVHFEWYDTLAHLTMETFRHIIPLSPRHIMGHCKVRTAYDACASGFNELQSRMELGSNKHLTR